MQCGHFYRGTQWHKDMHPTVNKVGLCLVVQRNLPKNENLCKDPACELLQKHRKDFHYHDCECSLCIHLIT